MSTTADKPRVVVVIVAGGSGVRFGRAEGKQLLEVAGHPTLWHSVRAGLDAARTDAVVVVCHPDRVGEYRRALSGVAVPHASALEFVAGGETRQLSVHNGVREAARLGADIIAVHDGARPLAQPALFDAAVDALLAEPRLDGIVVGHPVTDTLKTATGPVVESTPDRSRFWAVQTPQVFRADALTAALDRAEREDFIGTDDASVVEYAGGSVGLLEGPRDNLKITVAEDAAIAEAILAWRAGEAR